MKLHHSLFALVSLGSSLTAFATVDLTKDQAAGIKAYDLQEVELQAAKLVDQIVKVKVTRRVGPAEPSTDGAYFTGTVGYYTSNIYMTGKNRLGSIIAQIPKEGLDWYNKLPTAFESRKSLIVFAKIIQAPGGAIQAQLLGREMKTDIKGTHIEW